MQPAPFSAAILAGGRSRRMGRPKAQIDLPSGQLLDRIARRLAQCVDDIHVVCRPDQIDSLQANLPDGCALTCDRIAAQGPLVGIHAALKAARHDRVFVAACDMPNLQPDLVRAMLADMDDDVVIPRTADGWHPLHAVYRKTCLEPIEKILNDGPSRVPAFFAQVAVNVWDEARLRNHDADLKSVLNINTPHELADFIRESE
jgi:molybdopterin-guanine dinucleotide biosynthesis protein A